ncbi:farnesyl diphosphate synthase [Candidatus Kinetoplastibacterium blastocrithidii TCC012E]|uniref:Farnesyl diphosphate synthase n=1 Tax=Candidatus Kinetoplastidibacterium blastocrithidiae TCC012E TaxID=1208922 RepID=M1M0K7_9PROT|nr:farnesyl diphosphate synthase [Candidatus Kinetoplastibacterium blastocrithidii]AFZ83684.1 geranyltranstransferase [Candidatus Kinetoplastibacterium blastocrithidii (ex Strigomonas culicis)]AGF49806.1 farnesyl diphosphate synthase [Candidatus Kinetoplastibacterium blastocrithidii TCC012E]
MNKVNLSFSKWISDNLESINDNLSNILTNCNVESSTLQKAMQYSVLSGGKRIRALLVYASFIAANGCIAIDYETSFSVDNAAIAIELIHSYSLIHDDLPSMDNDCMRRGKPSTHVMFGEAIAILAGDSLQSLAFELLAGISISHEIKLNLIKNLALSAGYLGMTGGQAIDLTNIGNNLSYDELKNMHSMKTGAIIACSIKFGYILANSNQFIQCMLDKFAYYLGLIFQIVDDILDETGSDKQLGKTSGKDSKYNKPTYASMFGVIESRKMLDNLRNKAINIIRPIGLYNKRLLEMLDLIIYRDY